MTNFNFLLNNLSYLSNEDLVVRPMDSTCFRSALVPPSFRLRLHPLRMVATLLLILCLGVGEAWGQSTTYTSNVTFTAGTNGYTCKVKVTGSTQYDGMKLGTSSNTGTMTFTVPAGTTTIHIHAAGWNGDGNSRTLNISTSRGTLASGSTSMTLTNDAGVSSTSPFTLSTPANASSSYYKSLSISGVTGGTATITITTSSKRAVVWGVNAVVSASCTTNPTVNAGSNSSVTYNSATVSCTSGISSLGSAGCTITDYGFVIGTSSNPTIGGSGVTKHQVGTTYTSTGVSFSKALTGLSAETTYYVRPYATNGNGTAYGTQTSFTTLALPKYTVTLMDDKDTRTQASYGAAVTLPSRAGCTGYTFAGWTKTWVADQTEWTTIAPTIIPAGSYTPTANENLYPVYTKTEGGGSSNTFELVTDDSELENGDHILIVSPAGTAKYSGTNYPYNAQALSTTVSGSTRLGGTEVTISDNTITTTTATVFTLEGNSSDGWKIHSGVNYLYGTAKNGMSTTTTAGDALVFPISIAEEPYKATIGNVTLGSDACHLDFNPTATAGGTVNIYFALYTSNYKGVYIYKETDGSTTHYISVPACCTSLASINGSVKVISGTSATLQWDVLSGVDGTTPYSVSVSPSEGTSVGGISTVDGRKNCTISGLTAGTEYTFTINAFGDGSHCDKSQDIVATTPKITLGSASGTSTYIEGSGPGSKQTFTVTAAGLTGNLTVTAPTNFAVCATESGSYTSSITLTPTSGAVSTTVYFQLVAGNTAAASPYAGNITVSGGSATSQTVAVNGTVSQACHTPTISGQPTSSASYNLNVSATALSVTAAKGDVSDPTLTYQWYSNTANSKTTPTPSPIDGATSSSYTPPTTAAGTKYYFCEVSSGACSLTSDISAITVNTPSLSIGDDKTSIAFGDRAKDGSYELTFTVSGSNLAKDAGISLALSGTNASLFSIDKTSISQTSSGAVSSTTVTVTYSPNVAGDHTATLTITSTGATSKVLSLSGSSKWVVTWKVNGSTSTTTYVANSSKPTPPDAPADNTLNNCANKFMGWSCKSWGSTPKTTGTGEYDDLFTSSDYSTKGPSITKDTVIYAVFAEEIANTVLEEDFSSITEGNSTSTSGSSSSWGGNSNFGTLSYVYRAGGAVRIGSGDNASYMTSKTMNLSGGDIFVTFKMLGWDSDEKVVMVQVDNGTATSVTCTNDMGDDFEEKSVNFSAATSTSYIKFSNGSGKRAFVDDISIVVKNASNYVTQCADNQVRVTYNFNGGTGTACTEGVTTKSASYTVCSTEPEKNYYDFAGWSDGTNTYDAGDTYNLQATTEFTAQWTPTVYTITYNLNGGTQQVTPAAPTSYTVESSAVTLPTPTYGHNRFDGWYANVGLTGDVQTTIAAGSNGNKEYWAKWTTRNEIKFYADDNLLATIYRAADENLQASVAGQGSKPSDPDAPSACSSKVFMGWTETWFNDETNTAPADLNDATGTRSGAKTYYAVWATRAGSPGSYTYSAYSTTCCGKSVEVDGGSPSNGTVTFDKSYAWTCKEDREIVMTITPAAGYQLHTFSVATGDGKVAAKSMSADVVLDNNSSAPQVITLTFAKDADGDYDVTATFTEMVVTNWSWTNHDGGAAITTDPIEVYVDQKAQVDVTYTPAKADLLSTHTAKEYYSHDATGNAYVKSPTKASEYFTFYGKASTGEETTTITLTHNDDTSSPKAFQQLIYVKVKPLPLVHFVDNVHNESFDDVVATVSGDKTTVTMVQSTPTHADVAEPGEGNSCEKTHLHLIGWIRSDYSKVADYMAGTGDAPTTDELRNAGEGYWFLPDAAINVETYNGKTFYAVWAVEE